VFDGGGVQGSCGQRVGCADEPHGYTLCWRHRRACEGWEGRVRLRVNPGSGAPVRLRVFEAEEEAAVSLTSLAWDVENDLLARLSVDNTIDEVAGATYRAFAVGGEVMLHLINSCQCIEWNCERDVRSRSGGGGTRGRK
jgi:hypothetical protein